MRFIGGDSSAEDYARKVDGVVVSTERSPSGSWRSKVRWADGSESVEMPEVSIKSLAGTDPANWRELEDPDEPEDDDDDDNPISPEVEELLGFDPDEVEEAPAAEEKGAASAKITWNGSEWVVRVGGKVWVLQSVYGYKPDRLASDEELIGLVVDWMSRSGLELGDARVVKAVEKGWSPTAMAQAALTKVKEKLRQLIAKYGKGGAAAIIAAAIVATPIPVPGATPAAVWGTAKLLQLLGLAKTEAKGWCRKKLSDQELAALGRQLVADFFEDLREGR